MYKLSLSVTYFEYSISFLYICCLRNLQKTTTYMGKGDKKTKKGKISAGSYGISRKRKVKSAFAAKPKAKKVAPKMKEAPVTKETAVVEEIAKEKKAPAKKKPAAKK